MSHYSCVSNAAGSFLEQLRHGGIVFSTPCSTYRCRPPADPSLLCCLAGWVRVAGSAFGFCSSVAEFLLKGFWEQKIFHQKRLGSSFCFFRVLSRWNGRHFKFGKNLSAHPQSEQNVAHQKNLGLSFCFCRALSRWNGRHFKWRQNHSADGQNDDKIR